MKRTFFARSSLIILMIVFFLVPFAMRGARVSIQSMRNDVKDWLPANFKETQEVDWFWRHFLGERFVIASWEGCQADDESYRLMLRKLRAELPPSMRDGADAAAGAKGTKASATNASDTPIGTGENSADENGADENGAPGNTTAGGSGAEIAKIDPATEGDAVTVERGIHSEYLERSYRFVGDSLGLFYTGNDFRNWGGRDEKWVQGKVGLWYFITPDGMLYEWDGGKAPVAAWAGKVWRSIFGGQLEGKQVASFGPVDGPWYYENPRRLDAQLFRSVTTGPMVLEGLTSDGGVLAGNEVEAHRRLKGSLFGPDGKTTALMLVLSEPGRFDLHRVIGRGLLGRPRGRLYDVAAECGITPEELHLGGPTVDNVAIDEEGTVTLVRLVSLCVVLGVGLAYACFRTFTATIMVFFIGGISAVASIALVGWCNSTLDAVLMSMPALVYVLGISGAVHLINYYREAVEEHGLVGAPERAVAHGWKPALFCNMTTAFGLFSLFTSELTPIRKFGLFSGVAVMATLTLLFTYLPAALQIWPQKPRTAEQKRRDENPWYEKYLSNFWGRFGGGIIEHHYAVAAACVFVIVVVGWGVGRINTSINMLKLFDSNAKILHDYAWLETNLGKLVPMEVVVKVQPKLLMDSASARHEGEEANPDEPFQLTFLDRMDIVNRIQNVIEQEFGEPGQNIAGRSLSAVTFAPVLPELKGSTLAFARRGATTARLEAHREEFLKSEYLRLDRVDQSELWRVSLRIGALQDVDYGEFVGEIKSAVEPVMNAHREREKILRAIAAQRDGQSTKGLAKAKVLMLGASLGEPRKAATDDTTDSSGANGKSDADGESSNSAATTSATDATASSAKSKGGVKIQQRVAETERAPINQTQIFSVTLKDLLTVARLQVTAHDPAKGKLPENWMEKVGAYDCVVLVSNDATYDVDQLRKQAKLVIDAREHRFDPTTGTTAADQKLAVSAVYTGVVPIVYKAQRTLLNSLIESTFWSFLTITPLMILVARSLWAGLIAMLPNVLPVLVIFGAMGWMGIQVDIGSMMTASIALGVAVDDTIHYLTWFREELDKTGDRKLAILGAYRRCATPTFQAAIISGLGLSIFAFSTFTPTQRFGYLMLTILFMGVVAELIFFPALLAGPLGRVFKPRRGAGVPNEQPSPSHLPTTEDTRGEPAMDRVDSPHGAALAAESHVMRGQASAKKRPGI